MEKRCLAIFFINEHLPVYCTDTQCLQRLNPHDSCLQRATKLQCVCINIQHCTLPMLTVSHLTWHCRSWEVGVLTGGYAHGIRQIIYLDQRLLPVLLENLWASLQLTLYTAISSVPSLSMFKQDLWTGAPSSRKPSTPLDFRLSREQSSFQTR